jgi:nicotinate-nucleotide adenylyltransferase
MEQHLAGALGILGGTFDPPHVGHLILAETACDALDLESVLFVPAADPPHKGEVTPVEHRIAMLNAAIAGNPRFTISRADIDRPGPHYTVDMVHIIQDQNPGCVLYLLMGGDSLHHFVTWRDPGGIAAVAKIAVMSRPGSSPDLRRLTDAVPTLRDRVVFVDAPVIGISATSIRDNIAASHSVRYQLPDTVIDYIAANKLYT